MNDFNFWAFLPILLMIIAAIIIIMSGYVKAPPDMAFIISGLKKKPKILIGRAGIKIPFLERKDTLLLRQISVDIKTNGYIPTNDFIGVDIDAVAKVAIKRDSEGINLAMQNFLNMNEKAIVACLTDSLQGNMREIVGTVSLKELCNDRKRFGDEVQTKAQQDMDRLGVTIISCNIQKIVDERDLINALGMDNMAQIQKDASIAKANADRDVAIAEATAAKQANDARVAAQTEIATKNNELAIREAELKKESDTKKAEADAAYEIQQEEQRKTIEVTRTNADIAKQEREVELKEKEVAVKEQSLAAEIKKKAEADKYRRQQEAEAALIERQKTAEADKFEAEKKAEALKAQADAAMYQAAKEAEGIRAKGIAEAEAIRAKGLAEAEATEKKAEAMAKMQEAAILEMYFKVLPDIAKNVAAPLENVSNITMYGDGNTSKLVGDITRATTQISDGLTDGMGVNIRDILKNALAPDRNLKKAEPVADDKTAVDADAFKEVVTEADEADVDNE